jgi:nicotinamide-nucleotide amidase
MFEEETLTLAQQLIDACKQRKLTVATVESCTGGLIAGAITSISGASEILDRGYVTYSNEAKIELVGVPAGYFVPGNVGAVSAETAREMAEGCLAHSYVDAAVAVTGIAGPKSDDTAKPVGLVYIAAARRGHATQWKKNNFSGDRNQVRIASVNEALRMLTDLVAR